MGCFAASCVNPWVEAPGVAGERGGELLIQTAERMGKNLIVVAEAYTSKTCCKCGALHHKLGGNKRFKCPGCGFLADRDIHAAFNMFLAFLKETSARLTWSLAPTLVPKEALRRSPRREAIVMTRVGGIR